MTEHELKCWPQFFGDVVSGDKTFEVRIDDRAFRRGDVLWLREWSRETLLYTGREHRARVTYIMRHEDFPAIPDGICVMALASLQPAGRREG